MSGTDSSNESEGTHENRSQDPQASDSAEDDFTGGGVTPPTAESCDGNESRFGKYLLRQQLGRGGMGVVWKAIDPDLQRPVAIKMLGEHLAGNGVARRRFQREARAAGAITHPHVLTIHAVEEHRGIPFLVMEFVGGGTLKHHIARRGRLSPVETIQLGCQIAQGLAAAHAQGVIHRDIKPGNVMLNEDRTHARLSDFGLARVTSDSIELTSCGHSVGTLAYMSPESVRGEPIDARSDLFSLGGVLYQMLTGSLPFPGRNQGDMVHRILEAVPLTPHDRFPDIPRGLSDLVMRLLNKSPADRLKSAAEIAEALQRLQPQIDSPSNQSNESSDDRLRQADHRGEAPYRFRRRSLLSLGVLIVAVLALGSPWRPDRDPVATDASGSADDSSTLDAPALETPALETPVEPPTITVGPTDEADYPTLAAAIAVASKGTTIRVVGPGPYVERLAIAGERLSGLSLVAESRVVWRCLDEGEHQTLSISNVDSVRIKGFDFEINSPLGRALLVTGDARDITIEGCTFRQLRHDHKLSTALLSTTPGDTESVVSLVDCRFWAGDAGTCLALGGDDAASRVVCKRCEFHSPARLVYATDGCRRLVLTHNVFDSGVNAINLDIRHWWDDSHYEITNNTFVGSKYWLGLMNSFRSDSIPEPMTSSIVCNNLILGGERVQGSGEQWAVVEMAWTFGSNWWERDDTTRPDADRGGRIATLYEPTDIVYRDPRDRSTYLTPLPDSPLIEAGLGGDQPKYVGAHDVSD